MLSNKTLWELRRGEGNRDPPVAIRTMIASTERAQSRKSLVINETDRMLVAAKLDGVKTYMRMRRVPTPLQVKVIKWFDYLWLTQKCSDEEKAVSCLPGESLSLSLSPSHFEILNLFVS